MKETNGRIAAVLIVENSSKQLLLLNRRFEPMGWCLVGGHVNILKESVPQAIIREAYEEIGATLTHQDLEYMGDSMSINNTPIKIYRCKKPIDRVTLSNEHTGYAFVEKITPDLKMAGNTISFLKDYTFDSELADEDDFVPFGKYCNKSTIRQILHTDPQYLLWLSENTQFKIRQRVLHQAREMLEAKMRTKEERENFRKNTELDERHRKEALEKAVDTPYGKAVYTHSGIYDLIDKDGNRTGKQCNWYYGWSEGTGLESDDAE